MSAVPRTVSIVLPTRRKTRGRGPDIALGIAGIVVFLLFWEAISRFDVIDSRFFPPPTAVFADLAGLVVTGKFWIPVGQTMLAWLIGMAVATGIALALGFLIGSSDFLRKATHSTIEFLRPIPSVALIPLAVLVFGTKIESALLLIAYASVWQVLIQVLYGTADVDRVAMDTALSYRFGWWARVRWVIWPTTLPYLIVGLRLAATVALVLAITAGMVIGTPGLGKAIADAQNGGDVVGLYAFVIVTGLIGVLLNVVMRAAERRVLHWHSSVRTEAAS